VNLAERKTGSARAIQATPDAAGRGYNRLWSVSCPTANSCFAVGDYVNKADVDVPLAEQWNGRTWSIKAVPHPAGTQITLMSVSCTTAKACTAVGFYDTRSAREAPLVERWNGKAWKIGNVPAPAKTYGYYLQGVSCAAAAACTAVGGWFTASSPTYPLAERWNGTSWKIQPAPRPGGSGGFQNVSCTAPSTCTAIGYTFKSGGDLPFEESE